ncbi:MAG: RNA recognition motif domain-containing protein [Archaeoglobaceae archaeon]
MNIYIGNLQYDVKDDELRQGFESYGQVFSVNVVKDRFSGRSKGFAFIEMSDEDEAKAAIDGLNGTTMTGREIKVNKARPKPQGRRF